MRESGTNPSVTTNGSWPFEGCVMIPLIQEMVQFDTSSPTNSGTVLGHKLSSLYETFFPFDWFSLTLPVPRFPGLSCLFVDFALASYSLTVSRSMECSVFRRHLRFTTVSLPTMMHLTAMSAWRLRHTVLPGCDLLQG